MRLALPWPTFLILFTEVAPRRILPLRSLMYKSVRISITPFLVLKRLTSDRCSLIWSKTFRSRPAKSSCFKKCCRFKTRKWWCQGSKRTTIWSPGQPEQLFSQLWLKIKQDVTNERGLSEEWNRSRHAVKGNDWRRNVVTKWNHR